MSFLINFCFNSCTDPFCLALQLQAQSLLRPALRSRHDSLSSLSLSLSLCYYFIITFLMLIHCLIPLSLNVYAFSHNANKMGNTKGRGNWGGMELKISRSVFPQAADLRTFWLENKILTLSTYLTLPCFFFSSFGTRAAFLHPGFRIF